MNKNDIEVSVVMPCLNEAQTLPICINKAKDFFSKQNISGEIVIADNGSTDGSIQISQSLGCITVNIKEKGYGNALMGGIKAANGKYIIMADSDDSYDFKAIMPFIEKLREGYQLVMGNRFKGGIKKGAMPFLHRYLGNPVLSYLGRIFFNIPIGDFHCGLRGFTKEAFNKMELRTSGMEFASEIVVKAALNNMKITEVPTILYPDGRLRKPHLRTWNDGWRHLQFLLIYSPRWLFLYPGLLMVLLGIILSIILVFNQIKIMNIYLDIHSLAYSFMFLFIGYQFIIFFFFTKIFAINNGLLPPSKNFQNIYRYFNLEKGLALGFIILIFGTFLTVKALISWEQHSFGALEPTKVLRLVIPAIFSIIIGIQTILNSFFLSILSIIKKE